MHKNVDKFSFGFTNCFPTFEKCASRSSNDVHDNRLLMGRVMWLDKKEKARDPLFTGTVCAPSAPFSARATFKSYPPRSPSHTGPVPTSRARGVSVQATWGQAKPRVSRRQQRDIQPRELQLATILALWSFDVWMVFTCGQTLFIKVSGN